MARFNEILVGRYNRLIQKLFGMKGDASLFQLSTEMMTVLPMFNGSENRYLEAWDLYGISTSATGGAAQAGACRLRNPAGSNVVAVIQGLLVSAFTSTENFSIFQTQLNADLTTVASSITSRLDARGRSAPTCVVSATTNYGAVPGVQPFFFALAVATPLQLVQDAVQEIPLLPGNTLDVVDNTPATALSVSFLWRERLLEESERA